MNTSNIHKSWRPVLPSLHTPEFLQFKEYVANTSSIYPKGEDIFKVFEMPIEDIKVVVLGEKPSHVPVRIMGYSFAVPKQEKPSEELQAIKKELETSLNVSYPDKGDWNTLEHWREQGVFLLNTTLTVDISEPSSTHAEIWRDFISKVIHYISVINPCVWLLWGDGSSDYLKYISNNPFNVLGYDLNTIKNIPNNSEFNYILKAEYPFNLKVSKNSFIGCNHFLFTNEILQKTKSTGILW